MQETTTIRVERSVREHLRRIERDLGVSSSEAVARALDAFDADLLWRRVEAYYEVNPELTDEDVAWIDQGQRAQG